jgi:hypothetical protein
MLYIIGGVPLAGKSTVRKKLLERYHISGIGLETLLGMVGRVMPEHKVGIDDDQSEQNEKIWPWVQAFIEERKSSSNEYFVLEADYLTPEALITYKDDPNCKICFMLYADSSLEDKFFNIRNLNSYTFDWAKSLSDGDLKSHIQEYIERSQRYKKMCQLMGFEYFDTSENFEAVVEEAVQYLIGR